MHNKIYLQRGPSHHYKHDQMLECWQVPKQNLYAQRMNAHIAADQGPIVYKMIHEQLKESS